MKCGGPLLIQPKAANEALPGPPYSSLYMATVPKGAASTQGREGPREPGDATHRNGDRKGGEGAGTC